ncbi:hypothetical protein B1207_07705 [Legionella quinlivanii]|uniref:Uncharacterized protein n=1 Tax=Legionella quinlivanii TaxID=45073 RepID=A0A364LJL5_9GAMM|nr:hypothetical protein [Legionella quinlivanii]RAP36679.1 hypothetical protein B1207_07705 [Legionella quinlivanii]
MKLFGSILARLNAAKGSKNQIGNYVLYRIADYENGFYIIQLINTKVAFQKTFPDLISDLETLYGLHPVQACFLGIEFSRLLKTNRCSEKIQIKNINITGQSFLSRYGAYELLYHKRGGLIGFQCKESKKTLEKSAKEIALDEEIIQEFDAAHAFYIGIAAGAQFAKDARDETPKLNHLKLVVG